MMDWTTIVCSVIGSGIIVTILHYLVYRPQNQKLKSNEVVSSSLENEAKELANDKAQIDLGMTFMKSSLEMFQQVRDMLSHSDMKSDENWRVLKSRMQTMEEKMDSCTEEVRLISGYLNGGFKEYKHNQGKKTN